MQRQHNAIGKEVLNLESGKLINPQGGQKSSVLVTPLNLTLLTCN